MAEYLFIYGTLLKGEPNNSLLKDCILEEYLSIPGSLYNTGEGYPAAYLTNGTTARIYGELYRLPNKKELLLKKLDYYEDTTKEIFKRNIIKIEGKDCSIYSIADPCILGNKQIISSGSWLEFNRNIKENPISFAINFEQSHKYSYRQISNDKTIVLPGTNGLIVSAPHATNHIRLNKYKIYERYTAAISALMHSLTGASSFYTNTVSIADPNYYDHCNYKNRLKEFTSKNTNNFLLDIHGTGEERECDIYPGIGSNKEFLLGHTEILDDFYRISAKYGISIGSLDKFPALKQQTVTKYCATQLKIPSMQIEINKKYRKPNNSPEKFLDLVQFIRHFLEEIKKRNE
jgi:gamma-glutamylcyclotransferase (GGCT)/AIG2-like uncharacterized protein YtfP